MRLKGVSNLSIFAYQCKCGELNIQGGWQQIENKKYELEKKRVVVESSCETCGLIYSRAFKLTTAKSRPRMIRWGSWALWLACRTPVHRLPDWIWWRMLRVVYFLEAKLPL